MLYDICMIGYYIDYKILIKPLEVFNVSGPLRHKARYSIYIVLCYFFEHITITMIYNMTYNMIYNIIHNMIYI